jgi:hypothetical protein
MEVVNMNGNLYAICADNSEIDPIPLEKADLHKYVFSVEKLLQEIKSVNHISGEIQELSRDCYFLGSKQYGDQKVGFVFIRKADSLVVAGIQSVCCENNIVILTPVRKLDKLDIAGRKILNISLAESLNDDFRLDINLSPLDIQEDGLTQQQRLDYEKFGYKCYDKISIPDQEPKNRSCTIYVNDKPVRLGERLYKLLCRFAVELKIGHGGWINTWTLHEEKLITNPDRYHKYSELRNKLEAKMMVGTGEDLIESDGSKQYRLSVHPDFVCYRSY